MNEFWLNKWESKEIGFHQNRVHNLLSKYKDFFSSASSSKDYILVPLCGKSLDLIYLASLGLNVVGVELSSIACEEFFSENKIEFSKTQKSYWIEYTSSQITIICGDIFEIDFSQYQFHYLYDRASLIALNTNLRAKYISLIKKLKVSNQLIITLEFDSESGPPFSISDKDITLYYGDEYSIETKEIIDLPIEVHKDKITTLKENLFYLRLKN